jgi:hypothetical protein
MPDPSPLADQYGSGIYPGLRDPTRSGASRFIADAVKDPLRGWLEAAQGFLLQAVPNGSNQQRPAHAVWRIDTAKRRPFLSQFAGIKGEKVRDFPFQTFPTATDSGRSLVRFATLRVSTADSSYFAAFAFRLVPAVREPVFLAA